MESSSYYQKNKLVLTARKKLKYQTDPVYRQKCLAYQKAYLPIARKRQFHKHAYHLAHNGLWYRTLPIRDFWQFIGWRRWIIRNLEAKGFIPYGIFPGSVRRYSMHQVSLIYKIFDAMTFLGVRSPHCKKMQPFLAAHTKKIYQEWYTGGLTSPPYT